MYHPSSFIPAVSALLFALGELRRLTRQGLALAKVRLKAALERRAERRAARRSPDQPPVPKAILGLWGTPLQATARHPNGRAH